jgi:hypothetical protein
MRTGYAFLSALFLSLIQSASTTFFLKDQWVGEDFFHGWNWETEVDPTHGRVNYVNQADAMNKRLAYGAFSPASPFAIPVIKSGFSAGQSVHHACGRLVHR